MAWQSRPLTATSATIPLPLARPRSPVPARSGPTAAILYVGRSGSGTLNIEAGGQVSNTTGYLGYDSGSSGTATVTGTGSQWTNSS